MSNPLIKYDIDIEKQFGRICGVDEAGRGPLCGPVCCAAVILDYNIDIAVDDSKKLSEKRREELFEVITSTAVCYNIVFIDNHTIDRINILNATMLGMKKAIEGLAYKPELCLIDGNRNPEVSIPCKAIIKGDGLCACIAAASILAKVSRDRLIYKYDKEYPQYLLCKHKGYATALHYQKLQEYGITDFYRKSFLKKLNIVNDGND